MAKLKGRRSAVCTPLRVPLVGRAAAVVRRRLEATELNWLWPSVGVTGHLNHKAIGVAVWSHMPLRSDPTRLEAAALVRRKLGAA